MMGQFVHSKTRKNEEKQSLVKHEIQRIIDSLGHLTLDLSKRFINREDKNRQEKVEKIKTAIHQYDHYTDQELTQKNMELHQKAQEIVKKYQSNLDQALQDGKTDTANKIREEIDAEIKDTLLVDAFSLVAAAVKKEKGFDLHDSQINAALVLCDNNIAEMRCGGGKTIMQFLPAYFNTLTLDHHFVITPNDYLKYEGYIEAKRVFNHLGVSVGIMPKDIHDREKVAKESHKDIVYGTTASIAHSMLLDRMSKPQDRVLPSKKMSASIDEIDQIVLDNATTPFVISKSNEKLNAGLENLADKFVTDLEVHYMDGLNNIIDLHDIVSDKVYDENGNFKVDLIVDPRSKIYRFTDLGDERLDKFIDSIPYFKTLNEHDQKLFISYYVPNAIMARLLMKKGRDYEVNTEKGTIEVYNSITGRKVESSVFDTVQQALEVKEGLLVSSGLVNGDNMSIFDMLSKFDKVSGCSGTVKELQNYFAVQFGKLVREIPTPQSNAINEAPVYFLTKEAKINYIIDDIVSRLQGKVYSEKNSKFQPGAPLLIVSSSKIEAGEIYDKLKHKLQDDGIKDLQNQKYNIRLVTADNSDEEIKTFSQSGCRNTITVSTLMAGRGTDIKLGGAPEQAASAEVCEIFKQKEQLSDTRLSEIRAGLDSKDAMFFSSPANAKYVLAYKQALEKYAKDMQGEKQRVNDLGGLCVVSTDFINSERSQRQLLSRAGRQNDNGTTVQFVSFEDEGFIGTSLRYGQKKDIEKLLTAAGYSKDTPIIPAMGDIYKECQRLVNKCRRNYESDREKSIIDPTAYLHIAQNYGDFFRKKRDHIFDPDCDPIEIMKNMIQCGIEHNVSSYLSSETNWDLKEKEKLEKLKELYLGILVGYDAFKPEQLSKINRDEVASQLTQRAFSLLHLDHPESLKPKEIEKMKQDYFDSYNSAISRFTADAKGMYNTAVTTPQLDNDKRFLLYMDLMENYIDQMRFDISFDFLARLRGIDFAKLNPYSTNVSWNTLSKTDSYSSLQLQLKNSKGEPLYFSYNEKKAAKRKKTLKEYMDEQEEKLSPEEVKIATAIVKNMKQHDQQNQQMYSKLKLSSILELASCCNKIPKEDFYTMHRATRKLSDDYFGGKLAEILYDSGYTSKEIVSMKGRFLRSFYQYTLMSGGYEKLQAAAAVREKLHRTRSLSKK